MSHYKHVNVKVSGLEPNASYSYKWNGLGGNWPALIGAKSGIIASDSFSTAYDVNTALQFCATTGSCYGDPSLLPYSTENCDIQSSDVYSVLELVISRDSTNMVQLTKNVTVHCEECSNRPNITSNYVNTLNNVLGNSTQLKMDLSHLVPQKTYFYKFKNLGGNWPITVTNVSGSFVSTDTHVDLYSKVTFNNVTGVIADNIFNNMTPGCINDRDLNATIIFELYSDTDCTDGQVYTSDPLSFSCIDCLDNLIIENIPDITLPSLKDGAENFSHIKATIRNCQKNKTYNYQFHSAGGNWPVHITNVSGSFIANAPDMYLLDTLFAFCDSNETCDVNNNAILTPKTPCLHRKHKMNTLYLYVEPADCQLQAGVSNQFDVHCNDCFAEPIINITANNKVTTNEDIMVNTNSQVTRFLTRFDRLNKGDHYAYSFESLDANWPVIVDPPSGEFKARGDTQIVDHKLIFALPTGDALDNPGALEYNISSYNQEYENKFAKFHANLYRKDCADMQYQSANVEMVCDSCLPCLNCSTISFSGSPILELPLSCCSGTDMMFISITGANPDSTYTYELTSLSGQINFVPHTGIVYMGKGGNSTVPVLMTTKLTNREQGLAQARLTDIGTGAESLGFLGILCGEECKTQGTFDNDMAP